MGFRRTDQMEFKVISRHL